MRVFLYLVALLGLNLALLLAPWGSLSLSLVIVVTYLTFRPQTVLHPNNMVFAFYGLYVVLSSTLNLALHLIEWEYVLPWGQQLFWNEISTYVLLQAEFGFLLLFFGIHLLTGADAIPGQRPVAKVSVESRLLVTLYLVTVLLIVWFIESTAGLATWLNDYSFTYLTKREGHGLLNVSIIAFGNIVVYLLGVRYFKGGGGLGTLLCTVFLICALAFVNGVKSRLIFLLILFLAPFFMTMRFRLKYVGVFAVSFFVLLYAGSLVRTEGFYSSGPFFLEMLVGYFNAYQLHDYVVTSRDQAVFSTLLQFFVKPMQILGLLGEDASYDISVMLTKEFFPEQWYNERATQQWPLDTELYLNYYGFYLSWIPLLAYAAFLAWLYRTSILKGRLVLLPIFVMEFQRIFSTLRGTMIPWDTLIYVGQYLLIYIACRAAIGDGRERGVSRAGTSPDGRPRASAGGGGTTLQPADATALLGGATSRAIHAVR